MAVAMASGIRVYGVFSHNSNQIFRVLGGFSHMRVYFTQHTYTSTHTRISRGLARRLRQIFVILRTEAELHALVQLSQLEELASSDCASMQDTADWNNRSAQRAGGSQDPSW